MINWDYYKVLAYISSVSVLVPLLAVYKKRRHSDTFWALFVYLTASLLCEIVLFIIAKSGKSNLVFVEFFKLVELILIIDIFKTSGVFLRKYSWQLNLLSIIGCAVLVIRFLIEWTGFFNGFEHTCIIFLSVTAFYKLFLISDPTSDSIHPFFWFNLAFFVYFSASFFLFLFGNLIRTFDEIAKLLWTIHLLANMLFYYLITVGIWKQKAT